MKLDERLYGIAPPEFDAHDGKVYLTMVGLLKRLSISESTLRRNSGLMALRRVIGPGTYRWHPADVDAYLAQQAPTPKPSRRAAWKQMKKLAIGTPQSRATRDARRETAVSAMQAVMNEKLANYKRQA